MFVRELPSGVDPCGENGEFHSFCFDGPVFRKALRVGVGEKIYMPLAVNTAGESTPAKITDTKGFWYCDLLLKGQNESGTSAV